jgi:predicted pyridoxine 5'-phosphate oxidase superfamily flavin-nucleotide-binding protein
MSGDRIDSIAALEAVVGKTPPQMHLKVIDHLDAGALRWISQSPLMFAGFGGAAGMNLTLAGGAPGFAGGDERTLRVPLAALDEPALATPGAAFGSLFLLPGIGETLRVNGRVSAVEDEQLLVAVDECYGHCAKALIRSEFWSADLIAAPQDPSSFIAGSRFLALATIGAQGAADVSPKGDPAGCMALLDGDWLWFADRPGNRRVDSFRNIVVQPRLSLALMIPGASKVAVVQGQAELTTDPAARSRLAVAGKTPLLAARVAVERLDLHDSGALDRARLWPVQSAVEIDPAKLFVGHIKLNKVEGVAAKLARATLSAPGATELIKKSLEKDYRDNLY